MYKISPVVYNMQQKQKYSVEPKKWHPLCTETKRIKQIKNTSIWSVVSPKSLAT